MLVSLFSLPARPRTSLPHFNLKRPSQVLSNISIGISSAFSSDLISTTAFRYVKAPPTHKAPPPKARTGAEEDDAYGAMEGLKAGGDKFSYRVMRKGKTGYEVITEDVDGRSRMDLLNKRSKAKADRFCM